MHCLWALHNSTPWLLMKQTNTAWSNKDVVRNLASVAGAVLNIHKVRRGRSRVVLVACNEWPPPVVASAEPMVSSAAL